jgi:flagellin
MASILTNVSAMNAARNLDSQTTAYQNSLSKLSSGNRFATPGTDPSGHARANSLEVNVNGLQQASRNAADAASLAQVAEGGLNEINNLLMRAREITVASASDTVDDEGRDALDYEMKTLTSEIDRISKTTGFRGNPLLNGQGRQLTFQIGPNNTENDRISYDAGSVNASASSLGVDGLDLSDPDSALDALPSIDEAISKVNAYRAQTGALQGRLESIQRTNGAAAEAQSGQLSRLRDTDYATETTEALKRQIQSQAAIAVLAQANSAPSSLLRLIDPAK